MIKLPPALKDLDPTPEAVVAEVERLRLLLWGVASELRDHCSRPEEALRIMGRIQRSLPSHPDFVYFAEHHAPAKDGELERLDAAASERRAPAASLRVGLSRAVEIARVEQKAAEALRKEVRELRAELDQVLEQLRALYEG